MSLDLLSVPPLAESRIWEGVVIHHSATVDGKTYDTASIKAYHMSYKYEGHAIEKGKAEMLIAKGVDGIVHPWVDIGYNWCIEKVDGMVRLFPGRKLTMDGAHAKGFNETHLGICVIGNFDLAAPEDVMFESALELVRHLIKEFPFTRYDVLGHRETYGLRSVAVEKTCPGNYFDIDKFRREI